MTHTKIIKKIIDDIPMKKFLFLLYLLNCFIYCDYSGKPLKPLEMNKVLFSSKLESQTDARLFEAFHSFYKKTYQLNSEEGIKRYKIFQNNLRHIKDENSKKDSFKLGITKFTDITYEEFSRHFFK